MPKYARLINNVVQEVFIPMAGFTIEESFTPEVVAMFQLCPDDVEAGWLYDPNTEEYRRPPAGGAE